MSPLRAATAGATTALASFSSAIGTPNLTIRGGAPANTINRCNSAGGKGTPQTRHMQPALLARINKTDRNDARGIVRMVRAGLCRSVDVKMLRSQKLQMLLTHRKLAVAHVRFGSKADIRARSINIRFTPKSGHWLSASGMSKTGGYSAARVCDLHRQ